MSEAPPIVPPPPEENGPRIGTPTWIGLAVLLLIGIGVAIWFATQSGTLEMRAEIRRMIESEEDFALVGDVAVVLALQDQTDSVWVQARALQVHDRQPAPLPVAFALLLPDTLTIVQLRASDEMHVQAEVRREFVRPVTDAQGENSSETAIFAIEQFYRLEEQTGWVRTAAPELFWGELLLWTGDRVRVIHHQQDEALVNTIFPDVDELAAQACEQWAACTENAVASVFLTSSPAVFLDDPTANMRVVLETPELESDPSLESNLYLHIASPALAGVPIDSTGRNWLVEAYSVRVIADLAEQTAGPGPGAGALHEQALAALELTDADPGLRFETRPTEAPVPATVEPVATNTPTIEPTISIQSYVVQAGDTLIRIAERFNTTVEVILAFNNISNADDVRVGQELVIPPPDAQTPTPTPSNTPEPSATPIPAGTIVEYVVQTGDTIVGIATFYETTVEAIVSENNLANEDAISLGQQLRIPIGLARP